MKKKLLSIFTFCALLLSLVACKKSLDVQELPNVSDTETLGFTAGSSNSLNSITLNTYGFLEFATTEDFEVFREMVSGSTHGAVQQYLSGLGFTSYGSTIYNSLNDTVTDAEVMDYAFNTDKILSIQDVIMKPISSNYFILAMTPMNLTSSSYSNLAAGTYDISTMNKFATSPSSPRTYELFAFMDRTPSGYEETQGNDPIMLQRRFLGIGWHTHHLGGYIEHSTGCWIQTAVQTYSIFWIETGTPPREIQIGRDCP